MHEIHAAVNDTVATSEAFKRMVEVQRGLSASRIDFNLVLRSTHRMSTGHPRVHGGCSPSPFRIGVELKHLYPDQSQTAAEPLVHAVLWMCVPRTLRCMITI